MPCPSHPEKSDDVFIKSVIQKVQCIRYRHLCEERDDIKAEENTYEIFSGYQPRQVSALNRRFGHHHHNRHWFNRDI
jgi:hypothetical protein